MALKNKNRESLRKRLLSKAKKQIEEKFAGKEVHIIKAISLLDDLESAQNLLGESLKDWRIKNPEGQALEVFNELEKNVASLREERNSLLTFIENEMSIELPNVTTVATAVIGARLLASAGSKRKLAFMPSSTIQVLGAEKALFMHIKHKAKPPKHGHIFNHPLLQKLPKDKRGNVARILAGKIAIAAKEDYFSGKKDNSLLKEIDKRINNL
jgi:nucleolar protein 56